jgi:ATP-citrate lyase beta-subunit
MTREKDPQGRTKYLLIGGGIANFTDVAKTFKGVVMALEDYRERLRNTGVEIYVRRGGPNYEEGLRIMRKLGERLGVPIHVYGPETHMTRIVSMALGGGE